MIVRQYIKDFENFGLGMFVHFGIYSLLGRGEWVKYLDNIPFSEYEPLMERFNPEPDWAEKLAATAKNAGCRYVTLTTRHHDGFSLYDTCGLNTYDAPHSLCRRDLVREFTEACREQGLVPFFYHTLLDWHHPDYENDFPEYLKYLRKSVELLCTNYGKIGGIWFDGMWNKPQADWEEDALYGMIRRLQPEAMIINNTGMDARGALGHIELDSVTFERGKPMPINREGAPKYIASEMCEVMNDCWGFGLNDIHYKSPAALIEEMVDCRRTRSNFLLNAGPQADGYLRTVDAGIFELIGIWMRYFGEPFRYGVPTDKLAVEGETRDFAVEWEGSYYLFEYLLPTVTDPNVGGRVYDNFNRIVRVPGVPKRILSPDTGLPEAFEDRGDGTVLLHSTPFRFGGNLVVRALKFEM